jgi:hypothetical protein
MELFSLRLSEGDPVARQLAVFMINHPDNRPSMLNLVEHAGEHRAGTQKTKSIHTVNRGKGSVSHGEDYLTRALISSMLEKFQNGRGVGLVKGGANSLCVVMRLGDLELPKRLIGGMQIYDITGRRRINSLGKRRIITAERINQGSLKRATTETAHATAEMFGFAPPTKAEIDQFLNEVQDLCESGKFLREAIGYGQCGFQVGHDVIIANLKQQLPELERVVVHVREEEDAMKYLGMRNWQTAKVERAGENEQAEIILIVNFDSNIPGQIRSDGPSKSGTCFVISEDEDRARLLLGATNQF